MTDDHSSPSIGPQWDSLPARERLRRYWLHLDTFENELDKDETNTYGEQLIVRHLLALDELAANGEILPAVASLIHKAFESAVYYIWRSNSRTTCYRPAGPEYQRHSAALLLRQMKVLNQIAGQGTIDPNTLAKAQAGLEHEMSFYALSEAQEAALYDRLSAAGERFPPFQELALQSTPEAKEATRFMLDLLAKK